MSTYLTIERASLEDLDLLSELFDQYRVFYEQESNLEAAKSFLSERLLANDSVVFIAKWEGKPAGFTQLYPFFTSVGMARKWILNDLYVVRDYRRRGAAIRLMLEAMDFAKKSGAASISLETATDNHAAQRLYEQLGWVKNTEYHTYDYLFKD